MRKINDRIYLRPLVLPEEETFWREVFFDSVREHFLQLNLPEEQLTNLLEMQFQAQNADYHANYPEAENLVIMHDEAPAGRVIVSTENNDLHLIDMAILTAFRSQGIGTEILKYFFEQSRLSKLPIRFCVEKTNRAYRLYERLGFRVVADLVSHFQMEWKLDYVLAKNPKSKI